MNVNCAICSDLFAPIDEIYSTPCGHVFHHHCLLEWIKRSKSCPQCRKKTTEKNICKMYFNFSNTDGIKLDAETLQLRLDSTNCQIKELENKLKTYKEENEQLKEVNAATEDKLSSLENKLISEKSVIGILKQKIEYMSSELSETSRLNKEVITLNKKLKMLQSLQDIIDSSNLKNVETIVDNISDQQTLTTYIVFLKKALIQTEKKKKEHQEEVKKLKNDIHKLKNESSAHISELMQLRSRIEDLSEPPFTQMEKISAHSNSLKRKYDTVTDSNDKPSFNDTIKKTSTPSPYLPLKQNTAMFSITNMQSTERSKRPDLYILKNMRGPESSNSSNTMSILKKTCDKQNQMETSYNGFGGHSKCDIFPVASPLNSNSSTSIISRNIPKKKKGLKKPEDQIKIDKFCSP